MHALRKWQPRCGFDAIDNALRRDQTARTFLKLLAKLRTCRRIGVRRGQLAGTPAPGSLIDQLLCIGQRGISQITIDYPVDESELLRDFRRNRITARDQVKRRRNAGESRHALGATRAREQPKLHFG